MFLLVDDLPEVYASIKRYDIKVVLFDKFFDVEVGIDGLVV